MDIYAKRALTGFVIAVVLLVTGYFTFNYLTMRKIKNEFSEATNEFAEAVAAGDYDHVNEILAEEWWDNVDDRALSDEDNARICRIIQDSFTYEIQEDTWDIGKYRCSVTVSFTRLDYMSIFLSLEDFTIDEYIAALENSDKTVTIDVVFTAYITDELHPYVHRIDGYSGEQENEGTFYGVDNKFEELIWFYQAVPRQNWEALQDI